MTRYEKLKKVILENHCSFVKCQQGINYWKTRSGEVIQAWQVPGSELRLKLPNGTKIITGMRCFKAASQYILSDSGYRNAW